MDIWRIPVTGGPPEQITHQNSRVVSPVLLDDRTLAYTATADDGTGPWLYVMDVNQRVPRRWTTGVEHYLSIAASADRPGAPRRLVATVSNPVVELWSVPLTAEIADERVATRLALPTARAAAPRFGVDSSLFYLATRGGADGIWQQTATSALEVWKPTQGAVVGAVAIAPDGRRMCFPVRREARSTLYCSLTDGTAAHAVAESLDVRGAASWAPDGKWIVIGALIRTGMRVFKIPVDSGRPVRLVDSVSSNPVWSPDGRIILYSGTPRARSVPVHAVTPEGQPVALPAVEVDRLGDSYRFLHDGTHVVVKLGGFRRQDFWLVDVRTGKRRQITKLRPGDALHRFDVSPDGHRLVFERVRENSDVVLIELPPR
jgi:Tol biopolymer transport system component